MSTASEVHPDLELTKGMHGVEFSEQHRDWITDEDFGGLQVNPFDPTGAKPGSEGKVLMLAARYAAGLPLWHDSDCYDHGPELAELAEE